MAIIGNHLKTNQKKGVITSENCDWKELGVIFSHGCSTHMKRQDLFASGAFVLVRTDHTNLAASLSSNSR